MRFRAGVLLAALLSLLPGALAADKPEIKEKEFPAEPAGLLYFDDSDVIIVTDPLSRTLHRSPDAGVTWEELDIAKGQVFEILTNPYNNKYAVVIGSDKEHWVTSDRGAKWTQWKSPAPPSMKARAIAFHATNPDRMLYLSAACEPGSFCQEAVYYTLDGFKTDPKLLRGDTVGCIWAKSSDLFSTGTTAGDENGVLCVVEGAFDPFSHQYRLLTSTDFFEKEAIEPVKHEGRTVEGIISLAAVKSYIVAGARSEGTRELALYVTDDTKTWHRAEFADHKLEEGAYTILESTNYSMQVDVLTTSPGNPMGTLLTSNSNGTFFTKNVEHTNRNTRGYVDFEKIQNIQGIVMANVVDNWEDVLRSDSTEKKVKSKISFDDGRTFESLKVGDDYLHLHSVTDQRNVGRVFSSPAPGIVMGIGNTGDYLRGYSDGDLYVSDDAGITWKRSADEPHLYEFGDAGAVLVAIEDRPTKELKWSFDHGLNWKTAELFDGEIEPLRLTTAPDSTTRKFVLTASKGKGSERKFFIYSINFNKLDDLKACGSSDFEDWYARKDSNGEPTCIMGHVQKFRRRKRDSICFVGKKFQDPKPEAEDCKCTSKDYECDFANGFVKDSEGECKLTRPITPPEGACKGNEKTFKGPSGFSLIPGNTCVKDGGEKKDEPIERQCEELKKPVASGKISTAITKFSGDKFVEYYYLERKDSNKKLDKVDETVIMRTDDRVVYVTHDQGKTWEKAYEEIIAIYPHRYLSDNVYLITPSKTVHYSKDRAHKFSSFDAPDRPNQENLQILSFHPSQHDWLIWTGARNCDTGTCQTFAQISTKGGSKWEPLLPAVRKCQFVYRDNRPQSEKMIYCEQYEEENPANSLSLLSSKDWFEHKTVVKKDVINFATMSEFIVVAVRNEEQKTLQVDTSIDGVEFANAKFPPNFNVPHQQAYTVLESSTHAVFLHVTVNNIEGSEYGSIVKSNSNGTSYVLMVNEVSRNREGYVDFEKMHGLEGVAVINRVANVDEAKEGKQKKLKTYMTHNDGADWALIAKPERTSDVPSDTDWCDSKDRKVCSLHLHGYTERRDPRDTFSSSSAVGLMIATGNVGEYLGPKRDAHTFITRDGGVKWNFVAPGNWMWEYGDQGSIIVIVKEDMPTKEILYTLDEGRNWLRYQFSDEDMTVTDITTIPSDASRAFLLWGTINRQIVTVNLDFSGLEERSEQCKLNKDKLDDPENDYTTWAPSHPLSKDDCLFGHEALYLRKKPEKDCYNGRDIQKLLKIKKHCACARRDFECDYNYEKRPDGSCKLVEGHKAADPKLQCSEDPNLKEYRKVSGYRKIPLDTCESGKDFAAAETLPCPGYEEDFQKKHGMSGAGLFFAIVLPIGLAAAVGYWVWRNWEGKFGRIRLGDGTNPLATSTGYSALDRDAPWIKYPIMAISGVVAVVAAVPMVLVTIWRAVSTRVGRRRTGGVYADPYSSRGNFGRGNGGRYAVVPDDEGELLGEESDEDI